MRNKKFIVSQMILVMMAVVVLLCVAFYRDICRRIEKVSVPWELGAADVDRTFTFNLFEGFETENGFIVCDESNENEEDTLYYYFEVPPQVNLDENRYPSFNGVLRIANTEQHEIVSKAFHEYYEMMDTLVDDWEYTEAEREHVESAIAPYYIEVTGVNKEPSKLPQIIFCFSGILLIITVMLRFISRIVHITTVKLAVVVASAVSVLVLVTVLLTFDKTRTLFSIKKEGEGLYFMNYYEDMKLDSLLDTDITNIEDFVQWIVKEHFFGLPIDIKKLQSGCSTFVCETKEGDILLGRNFDYDDTDTLVIYSNPENGYASYGLADLEVLGVSDNKIRPDSILGHIYMLAAPYAIEDGVNEAGLAVGILELNLRELHQDNGKRDLLIYSAIRVLLDKCANVDEAIALLETYDIHTDLKVTYHLQIADSSGRAVVVEWFDNRMVVNELNAATNSVLTPGEHFDKGKPDERLSIIQNTLKTNNNILSEEEARDLLESVSKEDFTQWSCVYNLDRFEVTVYMDTYFDKGYSFGGKSDKGLD